MKLGKIRKTGVGLVAAAALAGGSAIATAGTASAADRYEGPELSTEQGDFSGDNLKLELTDPNEYGGFFQGSACTSALLDGAQGLDALTAYNDGDFGALLDILTSPGVTFGPAASNTAFDQGPNSASKTVDVDTGVYFYVGTCGGLDTALDPSDVGVSLQPVIVPDGIGSLSPALAFGSTASSALPALLSVLGNGGLPSGS